MKGKYQIGAIVGAALGIIVTFKDIGEGKGLHDAAFNILGLMIWACAAVWYFTRDKTDEAYVPTNNTNADISKLQNDLRVAVQNAAYNDAQGDVSRAAYWHSQAAVLQSQLRNYGA